MDPIDDKLQSMKPPKDEIEPKTTSISVGGSSAEGQTQSGELDDGLDDSDFQVDESSLVLGEYMIEGVLGIGGMGQVFRARHRTMDRVVALKTLPARLADRQESIDRFYSEIRAVSKLLHPNIVTAFDAGCQGGVHFLVMELIEGDSLAAHVHKNGVMDNALAVEVLMQMGRGLQYAHKQGIIHRDIKPSNAMLTPEGAIKILDFGLAQFGVLATNVLATKAPTDRKKLVLGTVEYMSPEQINAPETVDHRTDLYSLGATLFYVLTGRPMFSGEPVKTALAQIHNRPQALYEVRGDIDLRLDSIFQKLVAKNRYERFTDASDMLDHIERLELVKPSRTGQRDADSLRSSKYTNSVDRIQDLFRDSRTDSFRGESTGMRKFSAVGIDLGMTKTHAAYVDMQSEVKNVLLEGRKTAFTNLLWSSGLEMRIGDAAAIWKSKQPDAVFSIPQRWFGLSETEQPLVGRKVPPQVLVGALLRRVVDLAQSQISNVTHAVVTVPACYDIYHRRCLAESIQIAGVEVLQLLDKHLAATLGFLHDPQNRSEFSQSARHLLICTLNGSACEAAVVRIEENRVTSLGVAGDWKRGLLRWQYRLVQLLADEFQAKSGIDIRKRPKALNRLTRTVDSAFQVFKNAKKVQVRFEEHGHAVRFELSQDSLDKINPQGVHEVISFCGEALSQTGLDAKQLDGVLLVGSFLNKIPFQSSLRTWIGSDVPFNYVGQEEIAMGAAMQAHSLMPPGDSSFPSSQSAFNSDLGLILSNHGGRLDHPKTIVPKNNLLPTNTSRMLRLKISGDRKSTICFVENNPINKSAWNQLEVVDLEELFPNRNSGDPLQMRVEIDASGLPSASINCLKSNRFANVDFLAPNQIGTDSIKQWKEWLETVMLCNLTTSG